MLEAQSENKCVFQDHKSRVSAKGAGRGGGVEPIQSGEWRDNPT
jgi:hypothetical protein